MKNNKNIITRTLLAKAFALTMFLICSSCANAQMGEFFEKAKKGNAYSQYRVGIAYMCGENGVKENRDSALYWFEKCASQTEAFCVDIGAKAMKILWKEAMEMMLPYITRSASHGDFQSNLWLSYYRALPKKFKSEKEKSLFLKYCYYTEDLDGIQIWDKKEKNILIKLRHPLALTDRANHSTDFSKEGYKRKIEDYTKAAELGFPDAIQRLAYHYLNGYGVPKNEKLGMEYLLRAAAMGHKGAFATLGDAYYYGKHGLPVDREKSYEYFSKVIYDAKGNLHQSPNYVQSNAMWVVATLFFESDKQKQIELMRAAEKKCTYARDWLRKNTDIYTTPSQWYSRGEKYYKSGQYCDAIDAFRHISTKNAKTMYYLGQCFQNCSGVQGNKDSAFYWYNRAYERMSEMGSEAWRVPFFLAYCYKVGTGTHRNLKEARRLFQEARKTVDPLNRNLVDDNITEINREINNATKVYNDALKLYELGDVSGAFINYKEAAECGMAYAQNNLGVCYLKGKGVEKNKTEALYWLRQAAEQGETLAMANLGSNLVDSDPSEAVVWLEKAEAKGDKSVMADLGRCYEEGKGVQKNLARALEYYRKGAAADDEESIYWLGHCYYEGIIVEKDKAQAIQLYTKAAEKGCTRALFALGMAYYYGHGVTMDKEKGIMYMRMASNSEDNTFLAKYAAGLLETWLNEIQGAKK